MKAFGTLGVLVVLLAACGATEQVSLNKEAWDEVNRPERLLRNFERDLDALPIEGRTAMTPWTDTYWPDRDGGLAYRWRIGQDGALVRPMPLSELRNAARITLDTLSPAEKYDILLGNYEYPFTKQEIRRTRVTRPIWYGLCHGWAPASTHFEEPGPVTATNPDGITLNFTASDIKGLLSLAQQDRYVSSAVNVLGARCYSDLIRDPEARQRPECKDVNAGSFHIVLTNQLGLAGKAVIMDLDPSQVIWNHPVYSYSSTILQRRLPPYAGAAPGTVAIARLETTISYIKPRGPRVDRIADDDIGQFGSKTYRYSLEIDADGLIVGGRFDNLERPDFLWTQGAPFLVRDFEPLGQLYQASLTSDPHLKFPFRTELVDHRD